MFLISAKAAKIQPHRREPQSSAKRSARDGISSGAREAKWCPAGPTLRFATHWACKEARKLTGGLVQEEAAQQVARGQGFEGVKQHILLPLELEGEQDLGLLQSVGGMPRCCPGTLFRRS